MTHTTSDSVRDSVTVSLSDSNTQPCSNREKIDENDEKRHLRDSLGFDPVISISQVPIEVSSSGLTVDEHGAGVFFMGRVRNRNCGKDVVAVEYDSFIPLATKTLREIAMEAQVKYGIARIEVYHRIGRLNVGDISVAIIVSTPHRDESYMISRYVIEEIKTRAPIWKKEYYTDGETEWLKGHALCQHVKPKSPSLIGHG